MRRLAVLLLVLPLAAACGGKPRATPVRAATTTVAVTTSPSGATAKAKLPKAFVTGYLKSCEAGGGAKARAVCGCTVATLAKLTTPGEIAILGTQGRTPPAGVQTKLKRAAAKCRTQLKK